jgi:hypothetical protein
MKKVLAGGILVFGIGGCCLALALQGSAQIREAPRAARQTKKETKPAPVTPAPSPCPDCEKTRETDSVTVCAMYEYANHGTYSSYYAMTCPFGPPVSMDAAPGIAGLPGSCQTPDPVKCVITAHKDPLSPRSNSGTPIYHVDARDGKIGKVGIVPGDTTDPVEKHGAKVLKKHYLKFEDHLGNMHFARAYVIRFDPAKARPRQLGSPLVLAVGHEITADMATGQEIEFEVFSADVSEAENTKYVQLNVGALQYQIILKKD